MGAYELSNAIVLQAVKDYRAALSRQKVDGKMPNDVIKEIEKFFRSEYYEVLTKVDCEVIISNIRKEFNQ